MTQDLKCLRCGRDDHMVEDCKVPVLPDGRVLVCALQAQQAQPTECFDDRAVNAFAAAMKEKLAQARAKGRCGWQKCPPEELSQMLREHVEKGDPRDVANFCMFLWHLGAGIAQQPMWPICQVCKGSGEGDLCADGPCHACGGSGVTKQAKAEAVPVGVLHRGEGGAFRFSMGDHLMALYALPPGDHSLYTAPQQAEAVPDVAGISGDKLSEFRIDQWWFAELEAAVKDGTTDQKRAVFVVRNLLETVQRALHPLLGAKQAEAVPQGWKLVPVEPTGKMISEGACAQSLPGPHYITESAAKRCWQLMLAAAPQPKEQR